MPSVFSPYRLNPLWVETGQAALGTIGAGALVSVDILTWSGTDWDGILLVIALFSWAWGVRAWSRMHRTAALLSNAYPNQPKATLAVLFPVGVALLWILLGNYLGSNHQMPSQELHGWLVVQVVMLGLSAIGTLLCLIMVLSAAPSPSKNEEEDFISMPSRVLHARMPEPHHEQGAARSVLLLLLAAWLAATAGAVGTLACIPLVQNTPGTILGWWNTRTNLDEQFRRTTMTPQQYWSRLEILARWRDILTDRPFAQVLLPSSVWPTRTDVCTMITVRGHEDELKDSAPGCAPSVARRNDVISDFTVLKTPAVPVLDDDQPSSSDQADHFEGISTAAALSDGGRK